VCQRRDDQRGDSRAEPHDREYYARWRFLETRCGRG
jgi:hypothetical protein